MNKTKPLEMKFVVNTFNNYLKFMSITGFNFNFSNNRINIMIEFDSIGYQPFISVDQIEKLFIKDKQNRDEYMNKRLDLMFFTHKHMMVRYDLYNKYKNIPGMIINSFYDVCRSMNLWMFENINHEGIEFLNMFYNCSSIEELFFRMQIKGFEI